MFTTCERCGAVTAVSMPGVPDIDNRDMHEQWHEKLRRVITGNAGPLGSFDARRTAGI